MIFHWVNIKTYTDLSFLTHLTGNLQRLTVAKYRKYDALAFRCLYLSGKFIVAGESCTVNGGDDISLF